MNSIQTVAINRALTLTKRFQNAGLGKLDSMLLIKFLLEDTHGGSIMNIKTKFTRSTVVVLILFALSVLAPGFAQAGNNTVYAPGSTMYGLTYNQWSAAWWDWAFAIPASINPLLDTTGQNCAQGQIGPVWFLGGVLYPAPSTVTRNCTIPYGKAILFPILSSECSKAEGNGTTYQDFYSCAVGTDNVTTYLEADLDGAPIANFPNPLNSPYRVQSPLYYFYLPQNNVLGLPSQVSPSVADGWWLMLTPLSLGQHTLHFHGSMPAYSFELDVTYHLTISK